MATLIHSCSHKFKSTFYDLIQARVYRIEPADRLKIRFIAGKVIPKVVTTAAMTAGLTSIEIIKYLLKKDVAVHKNSYINLAFPRFLFS